MTIRREPISLFGEILDWMLAPLLLLWPMSLALTWAVAHSIADRPYDRELGEIALAMTRQATQQVAPNGRAPSAVRGELERAAAGMLRADDEDTLYFQVLGKRGEFIAGDARLPVPETMGARAGVVRYRDAVIDGEPVRVAWLRPVPVRGNADSEALVQVAETLGKRARLATEIVKGVILPQFVILPLAVLLVWMALSRGIRPLSALQQRIRRRDSTDLSPIAQQGVPSEVAPLVDAINDLLQRLDKTIANQRHFLADAAHQLKTPLAGLRMQAELVARELDAGELDRRSVKQSLLQIALSCERAAHMVNQMLALARAESSGTPVRRETVDLAELTRAVVQDFVPRALELGIDLGYEGPGDSPQVDPKTPAAGALRGEPLLLGEMVRNLVDNALRYTPRGGRVTARVTPDAFGEALLLQVEDSGPGIEPDERERVFLAFYRTLGTNVEGSGLGLAIVKEIAQRHGAQVSVADTRPRHGGGAEGAEGTNGTNVNDTNGSNVAEGPGACFTVRFPGAPAALA